MGFNNKQANFDTKLNGYSGQNSFKFWCQRVLPLVYDDSLSYMELLCKVVNYLNNTISDVANAEDNIDKIKELFNELQDFVNDKFNSFDTQKEVNKKLDEMAVNGTLSALIGSYIDDKLIRCYNTYNDMINDLSLKPYMFTKTNGYYKIGDGGGCLYHITSVNTNDTYCKQIKNSNYCTPIFSSEISTAQVGIMPNLTKEEVLNYTVQKHLEINNQFQKLIDYCYETKRNIFVNSGWYAVESLVVKGDMTFNGAGTSKTMFYGVMDKTKQNSLTVVCFVVGAGNKDNKADGAILSNFGVTTDYDGVTEINANLRRYRGVGLNNGWYQKAYNIDIDHSWGHNFTILSTGGIADKIHSQFAAQSGLYTFAYGANISNCDLNQNHRHGLELGTGSVNVSNVKCWGNFLDGVFLDSNCIAGQLSNVESQQNKQHGIEILGDDNVLSSIHIMGNNYKNYNTETGIVSEDLHGCGLVISGNKNRVTGEIVSCYTVKPPNWQSCHEVDVKLIGVVANNYINITQTNYHHYDDYYNTYYNEYAERLNNPPHSIFSQTVNSPFNYVIVNNKTLTDNVIDKPIKYWQPTVSKSNINVEVIKNPETNIPTKFNISGMAFADVKTLDDIIKSTDTGARYCDFGWGTPNVALLLKYSIPQSETVDKNYLHIRLKGNFNIFKKCGCVVSLVDAQSYQNLYRNPDVMKRNFLFNINSETIDCTIPLLEATGRMLYPFIAVLKMLDSAPDNIELNISEFCYKLT